MTIALYDVVAALPLVPPPIASTTFTANLPSAHDRSSGLASAPLVLSRPPSRRRGGDLRASLAVRWVSGGAVLDSRPDGAVQWEHQADADNLRDNLAVPCVQRAR